MCLLKWINNSDIWLNKIKKLAADSFTNDVSKYAVFTINSLVHPFKTWFYLTAQVSVFVLGGLSSNPHIYLFLFLLLYMSVGLRVISGHIHIYGYIKTVCTCT